MESTQRKLSATLVNLLKKHFRLQDKCLDTPLALPLLALAMYSRMAAKVISNIILGVAPPESSYLD